MSKSAKGQKAYTQRYRLVGLVMLWFLIISCWLLSFYDTCWPLSQPRDQVWYSYLQLTQLFASNTRQCNASYLIVCFRITKPMSSSSITQTRLAVWKPTESCQSTVSKTTRHANTTTAGSKEWTSQLSNKSRNWFIVLSKLCPKVKCSFSSDKPQRSVFLTLPDCCL